MIFSFLTLALVTTAYAGGGFEDYTLNPDGIVKSVNGEMSSTTTGGVTYDENGNVINQGAEASGALKALGSPVGVSVVVVLLLVAGGLVYASYKKSQPKNF